MIARTVFQSTKCKLSAALLLSLLAMIPSAPAQTNRPAHPAQAQRFLIVVETSRAMARRAENSIKTVTNLINSGLNGQMQTGDTLGVWTFNETVSAGKFPLAKWWGENSKDIADAAATFLRQQKFEKNADFRQVMAGINKIAENSDRLTVVFISSGETEMSGTRYDDVINHLAGNWRAEQQKARMPIVIVLRASRGDFVATAVSPAPWEIEVPAWPQRVLAALAAKTSSASAAAPKSPIAPAATNGGALIFTGKKSNPAPAASLSPSAAGQTEPGPRTLDTATKAADSIATTNAAAPVQSPVFVNAAAITNALAGVTPPATPSPTGSANPRPIDAAHGAALQVHARTLHDEASSAAPSSASAPTQTNPAQTAAALPTPFVLSRKVVLAAGLGLTAMIGVFLFIRGGGNTRRESLITRSYQRPRK
jgi:hypothetical protein